MSSAGVPERRMRAVIEDGQAVAERFRLVHVVRGEDDRAALAFHGPDDFPQRAAALRIEPGGRLVEEDDFRIVDQGQRQRQPLRLPAGERDVIRVGLVFELHEPQQLVGAAPPRVVAAEEIERLARRDLVVETRGLQLHADHRADLVSVPVPVQSADRDLAGIGPGEPLDHLQRGCLSGAVRPEEAEDLARGNREVDARDGENVRKLLAQTSYDDLVGHEGDSLTGVAGSTATGGASGSSPLAPINPATHHAAPQIQAAFMFS